MLHFQSLASFFAAGLLSSLLLGSIIAIAAWAFLRLSGTQSSRARFAVWFSALLLVFIFPWLSGIFQVSSSAENHSGVTLPTYLAVTIFSIWAIGASLALLRLGFAFYQSLRLRAGCQHIDSQELIDIATNLPGNFRGAELRISGEVRTPTAIGFSKPMILIPSWALNELSSNELQAILIHELEHLRRWDDWTNFAQKLLSALLFFHPAIWWIDRNLALEREIACDDAVLARSADRRAYAACLLRVAEKSLFHKGLAMAQAIIGRVSQTTARVTQILAGSRPARTWKPAAYILAAGSLSSVLFLAQVPIVSFQSQLPMVASSPASANHAMIASEHDSVPTPHITMARLAQSEAEDAMPRRAAQAKAVDRATRSIQTASSAQQSDVPDLTQAELVQAELAEAQLMQAQLIQARMIEAHAQFMRSLLTDSSAPNFLVIMQPGQAEPSIVILWPAPAPMRAQLTIPARKI
jgi:beta-lactamase regulating signal transducer with metallopeptidase domain